MSYLLLWWLFRGVLRSNEKFCVCNVFATPHSKNPVKSSFLSYLNVNLSYQRDKQLSANKKDIKSPECLHSWAFFMSFLVIGTQGWWARREASANYLAFADNVSESIIGWLWWVRRSEADSNFKAIADIKWW